MSIRPDSDALDPDRRLALSYVPARRRTGIEALWRLDAALGRVVAGNRDAMVGRIRLAWWREALEALDRSGAPAEPVLQGLAAYVLTEGISGAELAAMEESWAILLSDAPLDSVALDQHGRLRGGQLFHLSARLLGGEASGVERAGEAWALVDLARHSSSEDEISIALGAARARSLPQRWPVPLRPLGMLAALARRDLDERRPRWEGAGAPGRAWRMLRMRMSGRD